MAPTLLVADESVTIQRVVDLLFAAQGIRVVAVSDGEQALEYLRSARPDAVLVNANLQKRDGFEIARFVQSQPSLQRVPVLLSAGAFDSVDDDRVRAVGAAGVLFKPFEPGQLIDRVKELLGVSTAVSAEHLAHLPEPAARPQASATPPADGTESIDTTAIDLGDWFTEGGDDDGSLMSSGAPAPAAAVASPPSEFGPADAFAVLLAAEQGEPVGPVLSQPVVELSDGMVERIADRVAERLMSSAFGDSLRATVMDVSERLVREEIQRIRAAAHTNR